MLSIFATYGECVDCLILGYTTGPTPGKGSTLVKANNVRQTKIIDLPPGVGPLIPPMETLVENEIIAVHEEMSVTQKQPQPPQTTTQSVIMELLAPLPKENRNETFYENVSKKIAVEKKKEHKRLKKLVLLLKKEWRAIAVGNKDLERRMSLLRALNRRGQEVKDRLQLLRQERKMKEKKKKKEKEEREKKVEQELVDEDEEEKKKIEKKKEREKERKKERKQLEKEAKKRLKDIMNVARNLKRKVSFLERRRLVRKKGKCFDTTWECVQFVKKNCLQGNYRKSFSNNLLCVEVSC